MTIAASQPTQPEPIPDTVVDQLDCDCRPHPTRSDVIAVRNDDEAEMLRRKGLPLDAVILVPSMSATPMRPPANTWAMLVLAVDIIDDTEPDREDEVVLFAGSWIADQPPADLCDGDLVLVLTAPDGESPTDDRVDVEMLIAYRNQWQRVGEWAALDARWPWTIAVTANATARLRADLAEAGNPQTVTTPPAPQKV